MSGWCRPDERCVNGRVVPATLNRACTEHFEMPDVALCPFHAGPICSLCCTLERSCKDVCKTDPAGAQATGTPLPMATVGG